jgi:hypothetical protein
VKLNGASTKSRARKLSDAPACSNNAQNRMLAVNRMNIATYFWPWTESVVKPLQIRYTASTANRTSSTTPRISLWWSRK